MIGGASSERMSYSVAYRIDHREHSGQIRRGAQYGMRCAGISFPLPLV